MNKIEKRVAECFANVFPDIQPNQIPNATAASMPAWDSVAHITLLSAIAEEFGVELEVEEYEELTSYRAIVEYVKSRAQA